MASHRIMGDSTMRPFRRMVLATALTASLAAPFASAQDQPPAPDIEDALVDALIVKAVRPGPAFWRISDSDSTVWVMGVPSALPKGVAWNHAELKAHIAKANVLIVGTSQWKANLFSLIWMFLTDAKSFRAEATLDKTLPPETYARFQKAWGEGARRGPETLDIKPVLAALGVSGRFQRSLDMQPREPERSIRRDAFLRVRVQEPGEYDAVDFLKILKTMPRDTELACMDDALRQVEAGRERTLDAARGWARGDLRVAISAERGWESCIAKDPQIAALGERNMSEVTAAILKALENPGEAVAIVELRPLLAERGVLMRLKAQPGVTVVTPDVPGLEDEVRDPAA